MHGGLRSRVVKAIAVCGGLVVLVAGGAYAVASRGSDAGAPNETAGPAATGPVTSSGQSSTTGAPVSSTSTTTTEPEPTTTTTPEPVRPQADESVRALQERLAELGYDIGPIDGLAGARTYYTIQAFQKVEGLARDGLDGPAVREALARATKPGPMVPGGASRRVEIDIDRQVLFLWDGGTLDRILPVSTGSGVAYCENGSCGDAVTPTGSFRIGRKAAGLEVSPLGELWSPSYFYGGIAMHGSPSIPGYPASHGCVRIPMYAHESFFDQTPSGMMVYVVGSGPAATDVPPPPDNPTPIADPPPPPPPADVPVVIGPVPPPAPPVTEPSTTVPPLTAPTTTAPAATSSTTTTTIRP